MSNFFPINRYLSLLQHKKGFYASLVFAAASGLTSICLLGDTSMLSTESA